MTSPHMRRTFAVVLAAMCGAPLTGMRAQQTAAPQTPAPIFRSGTRLIVENVTVKDKNGLSLEGLSAKDFSITEDGEPQPITFVEFQRLASPVSVAHTAVPDAQRPPADAGAQPAVAAAANAGAAAYVAPRISSTQDGSIRYRDKRLVGLYFDATAMPSNDEMRAYSAARKFIDAQMDPSVLMAVMSFDGGAVRVKTDFTDNHAQLQDVILRLMFHDDLDGDGIPDTP